MENLKGFLEESDLAQRIKVPTRVLVHRSAVSPGSLARIIQDGAYEPEGKAICELEAGSQVIARGRIVKRRGAYFFKVIEIGEAEQ